MNSKSDAIAIASRARAGLAGIYGSRLKRVYLFGSFARGTPKPDSDVDIAVVLDRVDDLGAELEKTGEVFSALGLEFGVMVSRVFIPEEDLRTGRLALDRAVLREGIAA